VSALILYITRQAERTANSTKRLRVLMVLLIVIAAAGVVMLFRVSPQAIEYPQRYITATPKAICLGEAFTYQVSIKINQPDSVSRITEGWCYPRGICPKEKQADPYEVNFLDTYQVSTTATRNAPIDLPPGDWELRHCNTTRYSIGNDEPRQDVACYGVLVTVKDCEVKP